MLVDTHAHICDDRLWPDREIILQQALETGVEWILSVGYDRMTSARAMEMGRSHQSTLPAVGIHPNHIHAASADDFAQVEAWAFSGAVAAIGETGLDFHWNTSPADRQREAFRWHLDLALRCGLPVTVHSRAAEREVLDELETLPPPGVVVHCFGGDRSTARRALDLGCYLGVAGPITFPKSSDLRDLVRWIPSDRLLVETDCPYLSPHPYRGKTNAPERVALVAHAVADARGESFEEVCERTSQNAEALFRPARVSLRFATPCDAIDGVTDGVTE